MRDWLLAIGLMVILEVNAAAAIAGDAEWPCWRGPNRDGRSPDKGLLKEWPAEGPKMVWRVDTVGIGFASVAVSRGVVYTAGDIDGKQMVLALDAADGKVKWRAEVGAACTAGGYNGSRGTPAIDGDYVYYLSGEGIISCLAAKDGSKKWSRRMSEFGGKMPSWGYAESVLIYGDKAIVTPGGATCLVALDKKTGKEEWKSSGFNAPAHYSSCIVATWDKKDMVINGTGGGIVGVDARTGRTLWFSDFCKGNTANCPTPVFSDGRVFWANGYGKGGVCLKLEDKGKDIAATAAWTTSEMVCHH
ncbi:MAG: PQQ-like beta-propeller repeat protein, partial [Planctomycetota bacterium]|nr:PQQ-like beta-propeller repeat protein [Planctomycetota bacterium]